MGGSRKMEITVVSAEDLPYYFLMRLYVEVIVGGNSMTSHVDLEGDNNPTWNSVFEFDIKDSYLTRGGLEVVINIFRDRIMGDKFVGQVRLPVKDLFEKRVRGDHKSQTYNVSGTPYGTLDILYFFEEKYDNRVIMSTVGTLPLPKNVRPSRKPVITETNMNVRTREYFYDE